MQGLGQYARRLEREEVVQPKGLRVVRELFARLHEAELAYCHWKSNEHLRAALDGLTDLDILIDRHRPADLQRILADCGFSRFAVPPLRTYPAIEDYLACDHDSGRIVHVHLHYQLTLGERHLKGYRLPWDAHLLATRTLDPEHGVFVADPAIELLLLLVRAGLKHRFRDRLRAVRARTRDSNDFDRELSWLRERVDDAMLCKLAKTQLGPATVEPLRRFLAEPSSAGRKSLFAAAVRRASRSHRTYGRIGAALRAWGRELLWIADAVNRRYLHRPTPLRRISPRGGTVVVILGSDGAGKSTLAKILVTWLGVKLDVLPIYFGSGDGPAAYYRLPLRLAHRLLRNVLAPNGRSRPQQVREGANTGDGGGRASVRSIGRFFWALALSLEKRGKLRHMVRARNRGMFVICDRFPQASIAGFNDGPLLANWRGHNWTLCRMIAAWEAGPYEESRLEAPDLVIKLMVSPEVALQRRPEMSHAEVLRRNNAVRSLCFPQTTNVEEVNGDLPADEVARRVKRLVWNAI